MEYDKALFRVYEKTIDDLSASRRNRQSRRINNGDSDRNVARASASLFSTTTTTPTSYEQSSNSSSRHHIDNYVPFLFPNCINVNYLRPSKNRPCGWKLVYQKFRYRVLSIRNLHRNNYEEDLTSSPSWGSLCLTQSVDNNSEVLELTLTAVNSATSTSSLSPSSSPQSRGLRRRQISPRRIGSSDFPDVENSTNSFQAAGNNNNMNLSYSEDLDSNHEESNDQNTTAEAITTATNHGMNDTSCHCNGFFENSLIFFMRLSMFLAFVQIVIIFVLHSTYVGPRISTVNTSDASLTQKDTDMVSMTCLERALSTRPVEERSKYLHGSKQLLGDDELLQINIIDEECEGKCSMVHKLNKKKSASEITSLMESIDDVSKKMELLHGSTEYWRNPHYRFATDQAIFDLDNDMLYHLKVSIVNVTLSARCLGTGTDDGRSNMLGRSLAKYYYGYDTAIINQLMYSTKTSDGRYRNGYLWNLKSASKSGQKSVIQNTYTFSTLEMHRAQLKNPNMKVMAKLYTLTFVFINFFLVSSVTAITVRALTSSGVLSFFPFLLICNYFGMDVDENVLDYAHPWLGTLRRHVDAHNTYSFDFVIFGHLGKIVLVYGMYEACQMSWVDILYQKPTPVDIPLWSFASLLISEYFSLIYVRSASSAYFFPRYLVMLYMCLHIYIYSTPYGFFRLALIPYALLIVHSMLFTLLSIEVSALSRGAVSSECPREVYVKLGWSDWTSSLPHEWTIFHPLNARYIPLHDRNHEDDSSDFMIMNSNNSSDGVEENNIVL